MKYIRHIHILCSFFLIFNLSNGQNGMVAHWSFDSISGDQFIDHVTNQEGGTIYGCKSVPGVVGNALEFDGVDDFVRIPGVGQLPPELFSNLSEGSISVWFRVENIPTIKGIRPIFYYGREFACEFFDAANEGLIIEVGHSPIHAGSKRLYFTQWTNGCTLPSFCYNSGKGMVQGQWYHYVAVVGSNYNTGFLNGELMTDRHYNFGNSNTHEFFSDALAHENLMIGRGYWDSNEMFFMGTIDEIKIFDHALLQEEVDLLYLEGNPLAVTEQERGDNNFKLYPNPASEIVNMDIPDSIKSELTFSVFKTNGELVFQLNLKKPDNGNTIEIDVSRLSKGLYLYTIKSNDQNLDSDKLIIQ